MLRGLGLSLLVLDRHYASVSDWVERENLRGRLVYYRVPTSLSPARPARSSRPLADVVEVKDGPARDRDLRAGEQQLRTRGSALDRVAGVTSFDEFDWAGLVRTIDGLTAERERLTGASGELARLQRLLAEASDGVLRAGEQRDRVLNRIGSTEAEQRRARAEADVRRERAAAVGHVDGPVLDALGRAAPTPPPAEVAAWDDWEKSFLQQLTDEHDRTTGRRTQIAGRVTGAMHEFRLRWPLLTGELDDAVESIGGYRELHGRLISDDLPRFEAEFQELLRTNAIRDIAHFYAELRKQTSLIDERIDRINDSLHGIDYNHGRYISLETARTPNMEVRTFLVDLRACTDSALDGDDADGTYSERKFHQVRALVERFRGRDGSTEADRIWTQRVTDVRNWVVFTAVERWRDTDEEHETYTDSGGKSGGQKEKLAYTVLAASLAYQFKLSWGADRAKAFQMAVIDEAFGRGSDESTRYALALFRRLGLQLIVVTPLQKIHVLEHAVAAVGFVDNPTGAASRMHTLTIQEYRAGRAAHLAAEDQTVPEAKD